MNLYICLHVLQTGRQARDSLFSVRLLYYTLCIAGLVNVV